MHSAAILPSARHAEIPDSFASGLTEEMIGTLIPLKFLEVDQVRPDDSSAWPCITLIVFFLLNVTKQRTENYEYP